MPRKRVNPDETPEQRFKRVAEARTNAALERIRLLGNLADRRRYGYTQPEVDRMFVVLSRQMRAVKAKFESKARERFKL
ncbi:MAG: hypothetical protein PHN78_03955 [Dehalococcoidales bacterium]|nr:hypothetical protein [Dehalococcoidales bacterium]